MSPRERFYYVVAPGLVLILVLLTLAAWLLVGTGGHLLRAHWIALCVIVALVSGIAFWALTPGATGTVDIVQLGVRLTGGAGIGAAFLLLAWWLTSDPPPNARVVSVKNFPALVVDGERSTPGITVRRIARERDQLLVLFAENTDEGDFYTWYPNSDSERVYLRHRVYRTGDLPDPVHLRKEQSP